MTAPAFDSTLHPDSRPVVHLPVHGASPEGPALARKPEDGWRRARPFPMGKGTRRAFRALIHAIVPPPPAPAPPNIIDRIEAHARSHMPYMHWTAAYGLVIAILLLDWLPVLTFKSLRRLHRWPREDAADFLTRLTQSRFQIFRTLVIGVRGSVLSAYFDQDEVHAALGYEPIGFITERIELRQRLLTERELDEQSHVRRK